MADIEFRRIAQPGDPESSGVIRTLGTAALCLFVVTVIATSIAALANLRDDAQESRRLLETIQPCRPTPAEGVAMPDLKTVVIKRPGQPPTIETIAPGLEPMQKIVEGYIETAMKAHGFFDGDNLVAYVNEDGIRLELTPNILRPSDGWPLMGAILVVKEDEYGEDQSMTAEEAKRAVALIASMQEAA